MQPDILPLLALTAFTGAGGGSEQWEYNIGELCVRRAESLNQQRLLPEVKRTILDTFHRNMLDLGPAMDSGMHFPYCDEKGKCWSVVLHHEQIRTAFDHALREPIRVAADNISEISKFTHANARVVVSGGTAQNETLRLQLKHLCASNGLPEPIWADSLEMSYAYAAARLCALEASTYLSL